MANINYESIKVRKKKAFDKLIRSLKDNYLKNGFTKELPYDKVLCLISDELDLFPEDVKKIVDAGIARGDLRLVQTVYLGDKHVQEIRAKKHDPVSDEIKKDFENAGLK